MLSIIEDLTRTEEQLVDTRLLVARAEEAGIKTQVCDFRDVDLTQKTKLGEWIFTRIVKESRSSALMAARAYFKDKIVMNSALFLRPNSGNKFYQQLVFASTELSDYAIPTWPADSKNDILKLVENGRISLPLVVKPDNGSQGDRVRIVRSLAELDQAMDFARMVVQPYIEFDNEWRTYVMGGAALSSGCSKNSIGQNSKPGGREMLLEGNQSITEVLNKISLLAASILELEYTGVDIMRDKISGKFYIIEANVLAAIAMPHYSRHTGENLPQEVVRWFIERDKLINQKLPLGRCLDDYLEPRLKRLTPETQKRVKAILDFKEKPANNLTEARAKNNFFNIPLEDKLKFLYDKLNQGAKVKISSIILGEADKSVSWAGNFLVDRNDKTNTGLSTAHTLENGAAASAYYVAIKRRLAKK
ncbi:MAG: hypothetical protein LBG75_02470 [Candidatus Nomurabacteria bacterium]|jgi:glutathione synthase/RimK-type ligase-like ATP-grasp enzyme|nr:hypothetical protein [Candidatus Nomurabacteria bacterium]